MGMTLLALGIPIRGRTWPGAEIGLVGAEC